MKYLIFTLALISAFFVSADDLTYEPDSLIPAQSKPIRGICSVGDLILDTADTQSCAAFVKANTVGASDMEFSHLSSSGNNSNTLHWTRGNSTYRFGSLTYTESDYICPPDDSPQHTVTVGSGSSKMCGKPPNPDDDSCDEFGDNSFLPPKSGLDVPDGGSVCYTTSTGKHCKYSKNDFGDGYTQTGQQCSGEEPPYGEPQTPDGNDCAVVGSLEFFAVCPVDPNEACNPLLVNNETVYQCPTGCGSVNGEYVCVYEDKNANGIPDKDENPNNPDPDNPDPDNPDPDNPDMAKTNQILNAINSNLNGASNKLTSIDGKLNNIDSGVSATNQLLGKLDGKLGQSLDEQKKSNGHLNKIEQSSNLISGNTDAIAGNTKGILEALEPSKIPSTFNPDSSSSFYESSYENGFQGVWDEKSQSLKQTGFFQFLDQFKMSFGGGSAPDMQICFNVMVDLGCKSIPFDWTVILPFLKICILLTAAFTCRKIIFGG